MYAYTENLPFASGTYYRLQIINKDNSVTYSKVVVLKPQALATSNTLRVLQNPIFGNTIQLDLTGQIDESQQISLYDMAGNLVFTKQVRIQKGNNIIYLDVEKALSKGTYLLEARSSIQRRIIKITK
jgi:methionine-rich copper-binding protein CopC